MLLKPLAILLLTASAALAQEARVEQVVFAPGAESATVEGRLEGWESVDYRFGGEAGRPARVALTADNRFTFFNLIAPDGEAIWAGAVSGSAFSAALPLSGDYRARVFLMRNAARRGEATTYRLEIAVGNAELAEPVQGDFADGLQGGPDFWAVTGVSTALNLRAEPSTGAAVLRRVEAGTVLRNLGCRMAEARRWCRVGSTLDESLTGWAAGDFLREAAAPSR